MGRPLLLLALGSSLCLTTLLATAAELIRPALEFPLPVDSYHDQQISSLFGRLRGEFSANRSMLLRPSFFSERSFTRFWLLGFARLPIDISRAMRQLRICFMEQTAHRISGRNTTS